MSPDEVEKIPSSREIRFLQFASMEVDGLVYMTPADFLDSITEESPRGIHISNTLLTYINTIFIYYFFSLYFNYN